jgi:ubiquinone/menaquinone biosynthesis C-methylase UbiE
MNTPKALPIEKAHICPHKFAFMLDNVIRRWFQHPGKIVRDFVRPGDTVIDLGCGPGFFTIEMAKQVGPSGKVIAVDLQPQMLAMVERKAKRHGVSDQVACHSCAADHIGLNAQADFILAFYMLHETPDPRSYLSQVKDLMRPEARLLVVEPKMHVSEQTFRKLVDQAAAVGLAAVDYPTKKGGRSVLLGLNP